MGGVNEPLTICGKAEVSGDDGPAEAQSAIRWATCLLTSPSISAYRERYVGLRAGVAADPSARQGGAPAVLDGRGD